MLLIFLGSRICHSAANFSDGLSAAAFGVQSVAFMRGVSFDLLCG